MQEPFAKSFFTHTTDDTRIIANAYLSSLFKESKLNGAPGLNEHQTCIKALISYQQEKGFATFASLWQAIKSKHLNDTKLPVPFRLDFWKKQPEETEEKITYQDNASLRAKL
jgi:hypothetical protein